MLVFRKLFLYAVLFAVLAIKLLFSTLKVADQHMRQHVHASTVLREMARFHIM